MQIICPECQYAREVDETKIPARSQVATCPKCKTKFMFRDLPEEDFAIEEEPAAPVRPEPAAKPVRKPAQAPLPVKGDEDRAFPKLTAPGEDPKEELWDKLDGMKPPAESEPVRKRPIIRLEPPEDDEYARPVGQDPVPGWTGEFNSDFPDPMEEQFRDEDEDEQTMLVPPPFEQLDRYGFFHGLFLTIKLVLTSPRLFFSVMPVGGGLAKPLTFTILLTMVQGFIQYFWGLAGLSSYVDGSGAQAVGGVGDTIAPILMLLFMPAFIAAGQFIVTGIYHLLLVLMRADSQGFEGTFRALSYANAPIILGLFPMPIIEVEMGWMFVTAVWGLFLTITGLKCIHKTSYSKVIPVALIPLLLAMIAALTMYQDKLPTI